MKKTSILLILTFVSYSILAQSKKEIIGSLKITIDSLISEINKLEVKRNIEVDLNNKNKESLMAQIAKLEHDIQSGKKQFDSIQKYNIQLSKNNQIVKKEIKALNDSISILNRQSKSSAENDTVNAALAFGKAKSKWKYFMEDFSDAKYLHKDSLNKICNDDRCVSFLLTNGFLVLTYRINEVVEFDTQIFDLRTVQDLLINSKSKIYVDAFDKIKNVLLISTEGYDSNGRYSQNGTWSFKDKNILLSKKVY